MLRKIHLDFHTQPVVRNIGAAFNPAEFADLLASAHVSWIATPGKCQYGETYFDTSVGHRHPGLACPCLFPATVKACAERGIKVQAYFTLGLDDVTAERHPEWRQRFKDGSHAQWGAKHICLASPYVNAVVIPQALEMIERCPGIAGFWFDICLYCSGAFYSESFETVARDRLGQAADDEDQRWRLARTIVRECCQRIDDAVKDRLPEAVNYFNSLVGPGEPENILLQPYQEVENPMQFGGPEVMTAAARWLRWQGRPVIGLVSRFQGPWMDPGTLRTYDQIRFDVSRTIALGCHVSMGDHRHPDGTLDVEVYRRIGAAYTDVERCEPWLDASRPCREAVLLTEVERGAPHLLPTLPRLTLHAARLLEEIGLQFDVATVEETWPSADLVIWQASQPASVELKAALDKHVANGGALLIVGSEQAPASGVSEKIVNAAGHVLQGASSCAYYRGTPALGLGPFSQVITLPTPLPEVKNGATILAERLSMASETPPCAGREVIGAAIVQEGRVIRSAVRLFDEHMNLGTPFPREVIRTLCERLLKRRLVRHTGGTSIAAHLHRVEQGYALHLVHWAIERWHGAVNAVAEFPRIANTRVDVAVGEPIQRVTLEPSGEHIPFTQSDSGCSFVVPEFKIWQVIGLEVQR